MNNFSSVNLVSLEEYRIGKKRTALWQEWHRLAYALNMERVMPDNPVAAKSVARHFETIATLHAEMTALQKLNTGE